MRLRFVIPHYFPHANAESIGASGRHGSTSPQQRERRAAVVRTTIAKLHQSFGAGRAILRIKDRAVQPIAASNASVTVIVVTNANDHLIDEMNLPSGWVQHVVREINPTQLGFAAHELLRDDVDSHDFHGYLEDDLWIDDATFFHKLAWFDSLTDELAICLPHRFERAISSAIAKCYVDGDLRVEATSAFQDVTDHPRLNGRWMGQPIAWTRAANPHSGCFFLTPAQLHHWVSQSYFGVVDDSFIGPLESAATLGIARTFRVYKPILDGAGFLEIEHGDARFIHQIRG